MSQDTLLLALAFATLIVAAAAALYAWLGFRLKSGVEIRGGAGVMSSIEAEDQFVYVVTLENLKDRAVAIFKIFLEVDHGYYIELEDFEHEPLILGPFETIGRRYDPIDQYSVNMRRIRLNELLSVQPVRRRVVLSTSTGRYNVRRPIRRWDPIGDFFRNHLTAVITPSRSLYKGRAYGSGTKYIVRLMWEGRDDEIIPIYARDHEVKKFRGFQLTPASLESRDALETFLLERAVDGSLHCRDLEVLDLEAFRAQRYEEYTEEVVAVRRGWIVYHIGGWFVTKWADLQLRRENRRHRRHHKKRLSEKQRADEPSAS